MGTTINQILQPDKIGTLTESSGTITLAPSILTIGGVQCTTDSPISVAANLSQANTRYQIYAVLNTTTKQVELVVSQNENSTGPSGYLAWKLVGSYYTNGLTTIGFGSFVNIEGTPVTDWILYQPTFNSGFNVGTTGTSNWMYKLYSDSIEISGFVRFGSGFSMGTGFFEFSMPTNISIDYQKLDTFQRVGAFSIYDSSGTGARELYSVGLFYTADHFLVTGRRDDGTSSEISATFPITWNNGDHFSIHSVKVLTSNILSNKPIKDL